MRLAFLALLLGLTACDDDCDCDGGSGGVPTFLESEPNDIPADANLIGTLFPGDRLFIDGFVRDDLADPFDGFAFTAGEPLHVDFELFIHAPGADLDVCLYDPQLDETVACFATADSPERGGVDVFSGGLDFHLVIESFVGDASYTLELNVFPLLARATLDAGAGSVQAVGARAEHATEAPAGYAQPAPAPRLVLEQTFDVDLERGLVIERLRVR